MFRNYIKTAYRSLLKNKGFTLINIAGLALGLTAFLLILFYVTDELSYDRYNLNADNIYRVNTDIKYGGSTTLFAITPPPMAAALKSNIPEVVETARIFQSSNVQFKKGNINIPESKTLYADNSIFKVFTLPMIAGKPQNALTEPKTIVITERAAQKYFNKTDVVGQYLTLVNGNVAYKITGVIKNIPAQSHFNADYFMSLPSVDLKTDTGWGSFSINTYLLLKKNTNIAALQRKLNGIIRQHFGGQHYDQLEKGGNYIRLSLMPLMDIHLKSNRQYELSPNSSITYIYIFSAIAIFVLLIACVNFMNLSTARSANRAREVGIRKVLGSSRKGLMTQFLAESILVTFFAAVLATLAAWALLPLFNQLSDKELSVSFSTILWMIPLLTAIILVVGILAGSYPAFYLSAFQPISVLKGKVATGFKSSLLRNFLVVFQFAVSIFLIIGTLVIYGQLNYIHERDLGFNRRQMLVVKNVNVLQNPRLFKQEIKQLAGVEDATLTGFLPTGLARQPDNVFKDKGTTARGALFTEIWPVDEDYVKTLGMKMLKGRSFSSQLVSDSLGLIINESAARMLGYAEPINKNLYYPYPLPNGKTGVKEYHIIGVVKDFNFKSLRDNINPVVMKLDDDNGALSIRANTAKMREFVDRAQAVWDKFSPNQRFEYSFMDQDFDAAYKSETRTGSLFLTFTVFTIIIACLGLFSLAAYAAEQRTKEIGIRKVLGASVSAIRALLSKDFIRLIAIAILVASPLAWFAMHKWLEGFAYRQNIQWWVLATAALVSIVIAFTTISFQSIKAALANPIDSLRNE